MDDIMKSGIDGINIGIKKYRFEKPGTFYNLKITYSIKTNDLNKKISCKNMHFIQLIFIFESQCAYIIIIGSSATTLYVFCIIAKNRAQNNFKMFNSIKINLEEKLLTVYYNFIITYGIRFVFVLNIFF